jgi:uncharacterized protein YneF (UPF0154 family)
MNFYEVFGVVATVIGGVFVYHKWLMSYISERDAASNSEMINTLRLIQNTQKLLWEKFDRMNEKVIIVDNTAVREDRVRQLLEEYRTDSKQDNIEIKTILRTITENVEILKTEAAVTKALSQRQEK